VGFLKHYCLDSTLKNGNRSTNNALQSRWRQITVSTRRYGGASDFLPILRRRKDTLFYLYVTGVSVPVFGFMAPPEVNGVRSLVHFIHFLTCFYLGFIRKERLPQ